MTNSSFLCITGSYPPDVCGVGDYTHRLVDASNGLIKVYHSNNWSASSILRHIRTINRFGLSTINMQYPSQGYGWSIVPHLLCIYYSWFSSRRFSVTLHECSQLSLKSRLALFIILVSANKLIFTNEFELEYASKRVAGILRRSTVIRICSNIPKSLEVSPIEERKKEIVYFGQIRPNKGIEQFIEDTASLTRKRDVYLVGQVPAGFDAYFNLINEQCKRIGISVILNLTDSQIQKFLDDTRLLYLPFPDGVSERRGSVLAAFANGAPVMTTIGRFTTNGLRKSVIDLQKFSIETVIDDNQLLSTFQVASSVFIKEEMPSGWNSIVGSYMLFLK